MIQWLSNWNRLLSEISLSVMASFILTHSHRHCSEIRLNMHVYVRRANSCNYISLVILTHTCSVINLQHKSESKRTDNGL